MVIEVFVEVFYLDLFYSVVVDVVYSCLLAIDVDFLTIFFQILEQ
jgi:hypothetical protein